MAQTQYYTLLTEIGKAAIANATALGTRVDFAKIKVGDGGGSAYIPTETQTTLKNVVWESTLEHVQADEKNPNWVVIQKTITGETGSFTIREVGVFDSKDQLLAVSSYPETYKPAPDSGTVKEILIKIILAVSNTASINLKIDPTVVLATLKDIQDVNTKIDTTKTELTSNIETAKTELNTRIDTENEKQNIKIDNIIAGGVNVSHTHIIEVADWVLNSETNMYEVTIENPLLTERILISMYNENGDTLVPDATVKDNNIIVRSTENNRTFVYLIIGNAQTSLINVNIDDNRVSEMTAYSSKKIEDRLVNIEEKLNGNLSTIATSVNELITYC
ncbi:TPA: phage tail protein [Clostridioides difficile]|nr:phage tail protein [Clostridioides difficile]HBF3757769.1 phage tail protein [Clostridioides difficile]HBF6248788.1 phage tail protein [Clostridioides difficile]HBY3220824.1 phage tail protein [Clostridioides difficile]